MKNGHSGATGPHGGSGYGNPSSQDSDAMAEAITAGICGKQGGATREGSAASTKIVGSGDPPNSGRHNSGGKKSGY